MLLDLSYQLSMFSKFCIMNTLLHFLFCQSCRSLRNVSLGGPHIPLLSLIQRFYHGRLSILTSSERTFSALSWSHSTLSLPLGKWFKLLMIPNNQGRNEWARGHNFPHRITIGAPNHCGGRRKVPRMSQVLSSTAHLLPKDLKFEHGGAKLVSCLRRNVTSLRPC